MSLTKRIVEFRNSKNVMAKKDSLEDWFLRMIKEEEKLTRKNKNNLTKLAQKETSQ